MIDANAWIGRWPFAAEATCDGPQLTEKLQRIGVAKAIVSPLDAVLSPHAGQANAAMLRECEAADAVELLASPVINPTLADAVAQVEQYAGHDRVVAIRLLPTYHQFRLFEPRVRAVIDAATAHGLMVMIQVRMEDHRMQNEMLHLPTLAVNDIALVASAHPETKFLIAAALAGEIHIVTRGLSNVWVELSWLDGPEPVRELLTECGNQLVFGTHAPLLEPLAAMNKLAHEDLTSAWRGKIEHETLARLIQPIAAGA